jgi:hypothetical protein
MNGAPPLPFSVAPHMTTAPILLHYLIYNNNNQVILLGQDKVLPGRS